MRCPFFMGLYIALQASREKTFPLQSRSMFDARPFATNTAPAPLAGAVARSIITKTTTIKG